MMDRIQQMQDLIQKARSDAEDARESENHL